MYNLSGFGDMMLDTVRMDAYVRALQEAIRPDSVVLDIGTGTGVFAVLAHRFGARRVIAVEPNDAIQVAREIAAANGCANAIEFHQALSTEIALSERADVIISDLRGVLPFFQHHLPSVVDARRRLLAPGGIQIPQRDNLWISVIEDSETYQSITSPWIDDVYGLDMRPAKKYMVHQYRRVAAEASQLLANPMHCGMLDYRTVESPNFATETNLVAMRTGFAHGLCVWFDTTLADGIGFSNAPGLSGAPRPIYRNLFFPFLEPVKLLIDDLLMVKLKADLVGDDYIWRWDTLVLEQGHPNRVKAEFRQSAMAGEPISPARLRKRASGHIPRLNEDGEIDQKILGMMYNEQPLGEIARHIASEYDQRFNNWRQALGRVGELSLRYSL